MSHLNQLSALTLVDRMPLSTLVLGGTDGDIVHLNPACLAMLGLHDAGRLLGGPVTEIVGPEFRCTHTRDQLELIHYRVGSIMTWRHRQGHAVSTIVCPVLKMRPFDPLLVVSLIELSNASVGAALGEMTP